MRRTLLVALVFSVGLAVGGWLFSRTIPRSFLAFNACQGSCYKPNDLAGLLASVGLQHAAALIPAARESKECIAIKHPQPQGRVHFVLFPKRDVRNILELQPEDAPYVLGCFRLARELAEPQGLRDYRIHTNGPSLQHLTYLHFHLVAK